MPDGQPRSIDWSALRDQLRGAAIAAVVVFNIVNAYAIASGDWDNAGVVWLLLNTEGNPATWFSSVILLTAGVCAIGCGLVGPREHQRFWTLVGAFLVAMSMEEVAQFHELLSGNLDDASGVTAAWVVPGGIVVVVALVVLVRAAPRLDRRLLVMLAGGTALFVIGALGFEVVNTEIYPEQENDPRRNLVIATIEENLELAGGLVLAWATSGRLLELRQPDLEPLDA